MRAYTFILNSFLFKLKKNAFRVKIGNVEHSLFNLITVFIEVGANVLKVTSILTRLQRS